MFSFQLSYFAIYRAFIMANTGNRGFYWKELPEPQPHTQARNYLLLIGIDAYQHHDPLNNAVKDVQDFYELLTSRYRFGKEEAVRLLNEDATREHIIEAFDRLTEVVQPTDNCIIYFSGHGTLDRRGRGYWIPVEARPGRPAQLIFNNVVKEYIADINSLHTLLIVDSCFSGAMLRQAPQADDFSTRVEGLPSRWLLTSGRKEVVSDGQPGKNSPFAHCLLTFLRTNQQPRLPVSSLVQHVKLSTPRTARQTPYGSYMQGVGDQQGEMIFLLRQEESEESAWAAAREADELHAYDHFLEKWPHSQHGPQALARMQELEEEQHWKQARERDRITAYHRYLLAYPQGRYAAQARQALQRLREGNKPPPSKKQPGSAPPPPPQKARELPGLVYVQGGSFQMGDVFEEGGEDEQPVHLVQLSDFYMGKYAVTFEEYDAFCQATGQEKPRDAGWGRGRRPVINVSWYDAVLYCNWLSETQGLQPVYRIDQQQQDPHNLHEHDDQKWLVSCHWQANGYRLPTEAEWEYAARERGKKRRFGDGTDIADPARINFDGRKKYQTSYSKTGIYRGMTVPVGSLQAPNALGLHDLSGNVWEWCWDWYAADYYAQSPELDPRGPESGSTRVLRGGSWNDYPYYCRVAYRNWYIPYSRNGGGGFRVIRRP